MELEASLQDETRLFFVMELMDCDLLAVLNGYRFSRRANARRWICQIALGLSAIHASGVIHRDIKPENLLLDADGNIRISDFGSAYTELRATCLDPTKLYAYEVTGTWAYMAPEMLANRRKSKSHAKRYGLAVDYWSLGCVAFELVANEPDALFDSEEELRRYLSWQQNGHTATSYLTFAGLSEDAESLLSGLLAADPSKRYRDTDLRAHPYFQHDDGYMPPLPSTSVANTNFAPPAHPSSSTLSLARLVRPFVPLSILLLTVVAASRAPPPNQLVPAHGAGAGQRESRCAGPLN
ncbi:kinase-like domain-containing protein [Mycena belliarum]|uniref:non-specific serine/threonine protein kinase n=1 Tax=Mycena belliarum TaxID=1033014 RepID=A0AAD6XTA7_9AGAR|nr:kinase-like domain-containing protein [Mycena belliae]